MADSPRCIETSPRVALPDPGLRLNCSGCIACKCIPKDQLPAIVHTLASGAHARSACHVPKCLLEATSSALNLLQEDRSRGTFGLKDAALVKALIKATELGSSHRLCQQAEQWKQTSTKNVRNCAMAMEEVRGRWSTAGCC